MSGRNKLTTAPRPMPWMLPTAPLAFVFKHRRVWTVTPFWDSPPFSGDDPSFHTISITDICNECQMNVMEVEEWHHEQNGGS